MRIAIAGAGGFAYILAEQITSTANAVLVLSTQEHPEFEQSLGVQVAVVDYSNVEDLRYTLQGVDIVISTISGDNQLNLIDAARRARVRLFVPSEFEGALGHRPTNDDPLDRGSQAALDLLRRWSQSRSNPMQYTVFSCGVFYERFAPGGLSTYNIGTGSNVQNPGDFLVDVGNATAEIVEHNSQGRPIQVSMTSVYDVARFIAAAIDLGPGTWPREFKMRGDQMSVRDIVGACSNTRGGKVSLSLYYMAHY
ncbi:putative isoflavone reductase family protein [Phaeoacremonium minimum UCRPA7]|uniref:Putative isoflavone reductase family protein n=1 Tax=Phaeoacremonium minimum (strain UCR-PA7) TaxID=1286976 RepID=R8BTM6_PHAM7|nr:putative isoflavone reductase family protein [Phaeoacremonium minimum UCRPA7]EOO02722.1 putative isoflavone reductase family protein [Phaeoacremonium minimum UCRPA7]